MLANRVFLIRPIGFGGNTETASSNAFQAETAQTDISTEVASEHNRLVQALIDAGIKITILDPHRDDLPDAVFPNNWFSTHPDGRLVLYPMEAESRRREVRPEFASELEAGGRTVSRTIDLRQGAAGEALEGTGSLVLDPLYPTVYACRSSRTAGNLVARWCEVMSREAILFEATDPSGKPIYHTNVMLGVGEKLAIASLELVTSKGKRERLHAALTEGGRDLLDISMEQVRNFAGNALFLQGRHGETLFISQRGWMSLAPEQRERIAALVHPVPVAVDTLESVGGGSVRCMIAEDFLPLPECDRE